MRMLSLGKVLPPKMGKVAAPSELTLSFMNAA